MEKIENSVIGNIPAQEELEKRFYFIEDDILKANIVIAFRYIIFLIGLSDYSKLPGVIRYSIYKDIILHTATIVESCIHYCIKKHIDNDLIKTHDIMPFEWKDQECKDLYKISDDENVCGVIKKRKNENFSNNVQFINLNRAAKKAGIFSDKLFKIAELIRMKRNSIHLVALKNVDDYYEKKHIEETFDQTKEIIEYIETKLQKL